MSHRNQPKVQPGRDGGVGIVRATKSVDWQTKLHKIAIQVAMPFDGYDYDSARYCHFGKVFTGHLDNVSDAEYGAHGI